MARSAEALDMHVLPITSHSPRADFEAMLAAAHAISLHCPLTPGTRGMLGESHSPTVAWRQGSARTKSWTFMPACCVRTSCAGMTAGSCSIGWCERCNEGPSHAGAPRTLRTAKWRSMKAVIAAVLCVLGDCAG